MAIEPPAALEIVRFLATGPTPAHIVAYHPSQEANERAYALIDAERAGTLTEEERAELDQSVYLEHMMRLIKAEAHHILQQQASLPKNMVG
jgi:hypothetical protein